MFRLTTDGEVARLLIDRPEARNAIKAAAWAQLADVIAEAASSCLLVVSGAGGAFCAGADFADFAAMRGDQAACLRFREDMRAAIDALAALPIPTIARIDGPCYGAGVALALACDIRVAGPNARFAITPAKIGISFPQEDVHRLVALVGPAQAARLLFTAGTIDATEAARIGLADSEDIDEAALLANDPVSLAELKRAIALAARGVRTDPDQDRRFDALIGGEALQRRLEAMGRK